ncbi:MAG: phosphoribosylamine--glycine ligase [Granulosicoccaceae bacterium]
MKVLVVGGGGREHALAWRLAQSTRITNVFVAPGNGGTAAERKIENLPIKDTDIEQLKAFALEQQIDLTIVGPEAPLVAGIVDTFQSVGLRIFGPSAKAAQLEGSKAFSKDFLARHKIPTAAYACFSEIESALAYIETQGAPIVVKADGLAAGKGVVVAQTVEEAQTAARDMLIDNAFGDAGARIVVEEFLEGEEASFICMVDGVNALPMATSQDHKARDEGDTGPNTGGMGAYTPAPVVDQAMHDRIMRDVIMPTVDGMRADGNTFVGFLYAGVMIDAAGEPKVLEFNVRFGDPETQPIMMRLQSDLSELCEAAIDGKLDQTQAQWDERAALGVVLAAGGYPAGYTKGLAISDSAPSVADTKVFHAGTTQAGGQTLTSGGRVLCVVGLGHSVKEAAEAAYARATGISWDGHFYRKDIGHRAIARETQRE